MPSTLSLNTLARSLSPRSYSPNSPRSLTFASLTLARVAYSRPTALTRPLSPNCPQHALTRSLSVAHSRPTLSHSSPSTLNQRISHSQSDLLHLGFGPPPPCLFFTALGTSSISRSVVQSARLAKIVSMVLWFCVELVVVNGLGPAWRVADISKGSTVVIFGLGTVGLSVNNAGDPSEVELKGEEGDGTISVKYLYFKEGSVICSPMERINSSWAVKTLISGSEEEEEVLGKFDIH
ncbi:hypothetical protein Syun_009656 [Stephania yunnanensis]|uniref:Uncharacterized protein n=1 Tax=Stephania yunnanensis TaxID=152371 RepID=A0AAP0KF18_9MAGN